MTTPPATQASNVAPIVDNGVGDLTDPKAGPSFNLGDGSIDEQEYRPNAKFGGHVSRENLRWSDIDQTNRSTEHLIYVFQFHPDKENVRIESTISDPVLKPYTLDLAHPFP